MSTPNDGKEWAARLFALPFAEIGKLCTPWPRVRHRAAPMSTQDGTREPLLPSIALRAQDVLPLSRRHHPDNSPTVTAPVWRRSFTTRRALGLLGEWTQVSQDVTRTTPAGTCSDSLDTTAWQLAASVFLTGEEESFRGFKPNNVFSLANGTWGAFELVARYHEIDPDDDAFLGGTESFADPAVAARKASAIEWDSTGISTKT